MTTNQNPLSAYFRQTKISIKIPSRGFFYKPGMVELNMTEELEVKAMTAQDELLLRNPDALLNGQAVANIIKSCVPGVKGKAEELLVPDVSVLLLAIRHATYGDLMEFDVECPECKEQQSFERSIRDAFDLMEFLEEEYQIELQSGLKIYMSPHNLKTSTKANLAQFEQAKIMQLIDRDSETDEAKLRIFSDSFKKMVTMTFDMVADSIIKVQTPDGQLFTDRKMINELIRELEKGEIDTIREQITKLNQTGVPIEVDCKCKSCGNEWKEHGMTFDPSHFFD